MARTQTMVQLSNELVALLDEEAERRRLSRSALIREILGAHLRAQAKSSIGDRIAEGYRRVPPAFPDEWGQVESLTDRATADLLARLDAEERRGGASW